MRWLRTTMLVLSLIRPRRQRAASHSRSDHPFLFFIVDRASGLVLFMGRVAEPSAP